jgi:hypothetical protein
LCEVSDEFSQFIVEASHRPRDRSQARIGILDDIKQCH